MEVGQIGGPRTNALLPHRTKAKVKVKNVDKRSGEGRWGGNRTEWKRKEQLARKRICLRSRIFFFPLAVP